MPARCEEHSGIAVLSVEGELDDSHAADVRRLVQQMLDRRRVADFVVDLTACQTLSSEGLELLLWLKERCETLMGRLALAGCDENLLKILEMTRLRHRFECCEQLESALRMMRT